MKKLTFLLTFIFTVFLVSCDKDQPEPISTPNSNLTCVVVQTDVTSYGGDDGTITVNVEDGTPPYNYILDGVVKNTSSNKYYVFKELTAKTYSVKITDNNNKSFTKSVTLNQPDQTYGDIAVDYNVVHNEDDNVSGKITINASNGKPPYSYKLNDGNFVSNNVFTNLGGNIYSVTVKDDRGVETTVNDIIVKVGFTFEVEVINGSSPTLDDGCIRFFPTNTDIFPTNYRYSVDGVTWSSTPTFCGLIVESYHTAYVRFTGFGTDTIKSISDIYVGTIYDGYRVGDDYNQNGYVGKVFRVEGDQIYIVNMNHLFPLGEPHNYMAVSGFSYQFSYYFNIWLGLVNESGTLNWETMPIDILNEFLNVAKDDLEGFNVLTYAIVWGSDGITPHYRQVKYFSSTNHNYVWNYYASWINFETNQVEQHYYVYASNTSYSWMLGRYYTIVPNQK